MLKMILVCGLSVGSSLLSTKVFAQAADAADSASKSQSGAQMASQMMGAALMPTCAQQPTPPTCPMGILSMIQAGLLGGSSQGAKDAAVATSVGSGTGVAADASPIEGGSLSGHAGSNVAGAKAELAKLGYSLSADNSKLKLPNGKTIPTGSFGTAGGMSAAGFSEGQISDALAKMSEVQGKISAKLKTGVLEGGGEGGGGGGGLAGSRGGGGGSYVFRMGGAKKKTDPSVSGMTKNFGGDKIGVAGDDIFEMITRRYKTHDQANSFFKN